MSCDHPVRIHGLCALCGLDLSLLSPKSYAETISSSNSSNDLQSSININNNHHHHILHSSLDLTVSTIEAERVELEAQKLLLARKKLSLVVDLDETIIHATMDQRADKHLENGLTEGKIHKITLNDGTGQYYWIKLRPFCLEFLNSLSTLFEMHVYTLGNRSYAEAICSIIDPLKELFSDRILSRDDVGPLLSTHASTTVAPSVTQRKCLKRIFPHDDRTVLIIDDRIDVWNACPNLIPVKPYQFWIGTALVNRGGGGGLGLNDNNGSPILKGTLAIPANEESYKEQLKLIEHILTSCHEEFFSNIDEEHFLSKSNNHLTSLKDVPDIKEIILKRRNLVFKDCHFYSETTISPTKYDPLALIATFGGHLLENFSEKTTHLLHPINDKKILTYAKRHSIPVIKACWIIKCSERWIKIDHKPFEVKNNIENGTSDEIDDDISSDESLIDDLLIDLEDDLLAKNVLESQDERPSKHRKLQSSQEM